MSYKPNNAKRILAKAKAVAAARVRARRSGEPDVSSAASAAFVAPIPPVTPTSPPGPRVVLLNDCRDQVNYGSNALVDGLTLHAVLRPGRPAPETMRRILRTHLERMST